MERATIKQLKASAETFARFLDLHEIKVVPNNWGSGWLVYYNSEYGHGKIKDAPLLSLKGTITECYNKLNAINEAMEKVEALGYLKRKHEIGELHDWWQLDTGDTDVTDADLEHIADQIKQGVTSGQIVHEDDN